MASEKQIEANRRNAQKSTGPTSVAGKAASSMNALKTGLHAKSLVIFSEKVADLEELIARIRAILRRTRPSLEILTMGSIAVDFKARSAVRDATDLRLTHKEFEILHYLAERQGHVVHRDELLKDLWGYAQAPFTRSVDTAMARLRKKIEVDAHHPRFIHTVHGDGYCLTPHGQSTV